MIQTWILILLVQTGAAGRDSAMVAVPGFLSREDCIGAGELAKHLDTGFSFRDAVHFVCVPQQREAKS